MKIIFCYFNNKNIMEPTTFSWTVINFSKIVHREHSPQFYYCGCPWDILLEKYTDTITINGCDIHVRERIGLFLKCGDRTCYGKDMSFTMKIINVNDHSPYYEETSQKFSYKIQDWGWKKFLEGDVSSYISKDDTIKIFITMDYKKLCEKKSICEHVIAFAKFEWLISDSEITNLPLEIIEEIMNHYMPKIKPEIISTPPIRKNLTDRLLEYDYAWND